MQCNAPEMWSLLGQPILWNLIWLVKYLVKCNQLLFHEILVKCKKHFTAVKYCLPFTLKNLPKKVPKSTKKGPKKVTKKVPKSTKKVPKKVQKKVQNKYKTSP